MQSLTAYFFVSTAIGSVVISRERFEHELAYLAGSQEHISRKDAVTSEQCRVLVPSLRGYAWTAWDYDLPFGDKERFAFSESGFAILSN